MVEERFKEESLGFYTTVLPCPHPSALSIGFSEPCNDLHPLEILQPSPPFPTPAIIHPRKIPPMRLHVSQ